MPDRELPEAEGQDTGTPTVSAPEPPDVVLSEVLVENDSTYQLDDGTLPAMVELWNRGEASVALADLTLNDDPPLWVTTDDLSPGAYALAVLPDDKVTLSWRGQHLDAVDAGDPGADVAWARFGDVWERTGQPTLGTTNGNAPPSADPSDLFFEDYSRLDLTMEQSAWDSLHADPYTPVDATLAYERVVLPVTVNLKGVYGSLRNMDGKAAFSVDLNARREGGSLRGQKKLKLNNMVQDPSSIHEALTYGVYRSLGLPAPRVGYVQVYVNQTYFGVYANVEAVDSAFLDRNFGESGGNLYEGAYGVDFYPGYEGYFECDSCAFADDRSDLTAVIDVLERGPSEAAYTDLQRLVDMDHFLTYMAVEAYVYHWDGYNTANNYRIYNDPGQQRFVFLPWGADQTWVDAYFDPWGGYGRLLTFCNEVPSCEATYLDRLLTVADSIEALDVRGQATSLIERYTEDLEADPRKEWSLPTRGQYIRATLLNIDESPDRIRGQVEAR